MSSTETDTQAAENEGGNESAPDLASHVAGLSIDQLKQLAEEQTDENAKNALQAVIQQREAVEAKLAEAEAKKPKAKSRKGTRAPQGRQINAAANFNKVPDNVTRLNAVLEAAKQSDGTYLMTPEMIQLGISAYYEERRRENKGDTKAKKKDKDKPIIPATGEATEPAAAEAPAVEATTDASAPVEPTAAVSDAVNEQGDVAAAPAPAPSNEFDPYGASGEGAGE